VRHTEQHQQPGSIQRTDHLAIDQHRCFSHSAHHRSHGAGYCQARDLRYSRCVGTLVYRSKWRWCCDCTG